MNFIATDMLKNSRILFFLSLTIFLCPVTYADPLEEANAALLKKDFARAEELYRAQLQASPDSPEASYQLGVVLALENKPWEAVQLLEKVVPLLEGDDQAFAYFNIGAIYAKE